MASPGQKGSFEMTDSQEILSRFDMLAVNGIVKMLHQSGVLVKINRCDSQKNNCNDYISNAWLIMIILFIIIIY